MKAQLKQTAIHMLTLALLFVAAYLFAGCSATKIKFEKTSDGTTKYSIWHNDHWLKTEAESLTGGMSQDGQFSLGMTGLKSSPSEEFNRTMQTYTAAVVSMMQIAAAAYNPSSSAAVRGEGAAATQFSFEVSLKDVGIGDGVAISEANRELVKANLRKVLGVEGAATLSPAAFSSDNIDVAFDVPQDGKARFVVTPPADAVDAYFMRVIMK